MSIRRRDDSIKGGRGIDGSKGEKFTRQYNQNEWDVRPASAANERSYSRNSKKGQDQWTELGSQELLRNKQPFDATASARDIWSDAVEGNGEVNSGFSGPVKYGVNKRQ